MLAYSLVTTVNTVLFGISKTSGIRDPRGGGIPGRGWRIGRKAVCSSRKRKDRDKKRYTSQDSDNDSQQVKARVEGREEQIYKVFLKMKGGGCRFHWCLAP